MHDELSSTNEHEAPTDRLTALLELAGVLLIALGVGLAWLPLAPTAIGIGCLRWAYVRGAEPDPDDTEDGDQ